MKQINRFGLGTLIIALIIPAIIIARKETVSPNIMIELLVLILIGFIALVMEEK